MVYVHIEHKLYQANYVKTCSNCGSQVKTISSEEVIAQNSSKVAMSSCGYCGNDVVVILERVKPEWVELATCGKLACSIQTCNTPWCKQEFLIQWVENFIEYKRSEEWHVPVACPHCHEEHWVNLYELHEN